MLIAFVSGAGLVWGVDGLYQAEAPFVLVSQGGDAANLILVPILLGSMWLARRGSLIGLLLWPGALFDGLYAYAVYLVSAPFTTLVFVYVLLVTLSAFTLIGGEHRRGGSPPAPGRIASTDHRGRSGRHRGPGLRRTDGHRVQHARTSRD